MGPNSQHTFFCEKSLHRRTLASLAAGNPVSAIAIISFIGSPYCTKTMLNWVQAVLGAMGQCIDTNRTLADHTCLWVIPQTVLLVKLSLEEN